MENGKVGNWMEFFQEGIQTVRVSKSSHHSDSAKKTIACAGPGQAIALVLAVLAPRYPYGQIGMRLSSESWEVRARDGEQCELWMSYHDFHKFRSKLGIDHAAEHRVKIRLCLEQADTEAAVASISKKIRIRVRRS